MTRRTLFMGRKRALLGAGVLVLAAAAGISYAAIPGGDGEIDACYGKVTGIVRIVDAEAGQTCHANEQAISWRQQDEPIRGFRSRRATPDEVDITVVGEGPIGFPAESGTHILSLKLPQGVYHADATIAVRKGFGNGDFLCWVHDGTTFSIFTRTTLGDAPGHVKRNTVSGTGFYSIPAGGGALTLECWQANVPEVPGSPSGDNPTVFFATLDAVTVTRATLVRYPAGTTTELP
jgi:hypothetical protein